MLLRLLGWVGEPSIRIAMLVGVIIIYAGGAVSRWRQASRRRRGFYIAAGILLALWQWHMVWWLFAGAALSLIAGLDDLWRGERPTSNATHSGMVSSGETKES